MHNVQVPAYEDAIFRSKQETQWLGLIDTDSDIEYFLSVGNAIEDEEKAVMKFIPKLRERMKL